MKSSILLDDIIEEAREAGGILELDFTRESHYRFFLDHLGSEENLKRTAPELLASLRTQMNGIQHAEPENTLHLTDDYLVHELRITPDLEDRTNALAFRLSAIAELSLCSTNLIPQVSVCHYFRDARTKDIIKQIDQTVSGETNRFVSPTACDSLTAGLSGLPGTALRSILAVKSAFYTDPQ